MRFEIYESAKHSQFGNSVTFEKWEWRWRLRAANGRIMADGSEGYSTRAAVRRAILRIMSTLLSQGHMFPIVEVES